MARTDLAAKIEGWVFPLAFTRTGKMTRCEVPGHEGKRYEVTLIRDGLRIICTCEDRETKEACLGIRHALCYHALASVMAAMRLQGKSCEWHDRPPAGATVIEVGSAHSESVMYVTVKGDDPKT